MNSAFYSESSSSSDINVDEDWSDLDFLPEKKVDKIKIKMSGPLKTWSKEKEKSRRKSGSKKKVEGNNHQKSNNFGTSKRQNVDNIGDLSKHHNADNIEELTNLHSVVSVKESTKTAPKRTRKRLLTRISESERRTRRMERVSGQRKKICSSVEIMKVKIPGCVNVGDKVLSIYYKNCWTFGGRDLKKLSLLEKKKEKKVKNQNWYPLLNILIIFTTKKTLKLCTQTFTN